MKPLLQLNQNNDYRSWVRELKQRYLQARLRASAEANRTLLEYYWSLGKDIADRQYANTYGSAFYRTLSHDLRAEMPGEKGFSETNIRYMCRFYELYSQTLKNLPHLAEDLERQSRLPGIDDSDGQNLPHPADDLRKELFSIPWDHQRRIIDKCKGNPEKALFFVRKVIEHNWGRDMLLNFLSTDLYERSGKAISNFSQTLPAMQSDLAQQVTKDPYVFNFLTMTEHYNERELEDALVANVTKFLVELGTGFAFMGRQYRLQVGTKESFIDLLFYNTRIHAYCCIELKATSFKPEYLGQLSFYVSAVNHQLKTKQDNPTIGLLICKDKDNIEAQYALEGYNLPLGISEYELSKLIPEEFKSSLPTIEEIESSLEQLSENDDK
ncbi:MAG: DUF1016 family protein [Muribaculaceae bacterium]|nr:DUF1016 family protein [Muribaculaceae bacterium]